MGELIPRVDNKEALPLKKERAQNAKGSISISEGKKILLKRQE